MLITGWARYEGGDRNGDYIVHDVEAGRQHTAVVCGTSEFILFLLMFEPT
jgi:hypothetical protein